MPMKPGNSQEIIAENIAMLISEGKEQDEAIAIAYEFAGLAKPEKSTKKFKGSLAIVKSNSGNGARYVEGYLVRYTDSEHRDLQGEYFTKSTNFLMQAGYPIKGAPTMYHHGMDELGAVGIGLLDFVNEDDIGLFVRSKLYEREDYERMLKEISKRKSLNLSQEVITRKAELAVKAIDTVLNTVPHQWSMGAYPPTVEVLPDGHIAQCGIVEGALTVIPAEPNGTEARIYQKSLFEAFTLSSPVAATESPVTGSAPEQSAIKQSNNKHPGVKQMDMQAFRDAVAALLAMIDQGAMEEEMDSKQVDEEELEEETMKAAEELLEEDEKTKQALEEEEKKEEGAKSASKLLDTWLNDNLDEIFVRAFANIENKRAKVNAAFKSAMPDKVPQSKRSRAGAYRDGQAPAQIGKAQKPGLASFIKSAIKDDFRDFYGKAQNPYIGDHGGYLLGQELSNEILPPLRENVVAFDAGVRQRTISQGQGIYTVAKMTTAPTAYRPGINTAIGDSDASFDTITAYLRPIAAQCIIPFQLLAQSPMAVEETIREEMIRSISLQIDIEILNGVGAVTGTNTGAEIRGIKTVLEADATLNTTNIKTLATNGAKPTFADASAAETQIANSNVPDTDPKAWIMNARSRGRFRDLIATTGEPLFRENFGNEPFARLLGYPIHVGNQISNTITTGTNTDTSEIYFGAWRYAEYIMQDQLEVVVDRVTLANQLQARIIAYTYSDFIVHYPQAFYLMKGVR